MRLKVVSKVVLILLVLGSSSKANQDVNDTNDLRTVSDYIRYAMLHSPQLKAAFEQFKAALEQIPQAKSLDDPKFTYSYFINEVETRVGPQRQKFGIMQIFPWFGKLEARADAATAKAKAAEAAYETTKFRLIKDVKENFYEYAYLEFAIEIAKDNLELLKHFEQIARTKYRANIANHPDVIRAQLELAKLEDTLKSLEELRGPIQAKLNSILNRPAEATLPPPTRERLAYVHLDSQQVIKMLLEANPELAKLDWEIKAAESNIELAEKKFYPDIGLGVDWIQTDSALAAGTRDSGKDVVALMFSINIPLWRDNYTAAENQAYSKLRQAEHNRQSAENNSIVQAIQLLYDIEDSQRKIELYQNVLIPKTKELVQTSEDAYRAGTVDFLSLIDSQRMLLRYRLEYEQAVTRYWKMLARLESLIGRELI